MEISELGVGKQESADSNFQIALTRLRIAITLNALKLTILDLVV
ncbi:hypothetical protein [Myxosarcina sp. GI1(2024)]